jgi:hypothetical protein
MSDPPGRNFSKVGTSCLIVDRYETCDGGTVDKYDDNDSYDGRYRLSDIQSGSKSIKPIENTLKKSECQRSQDQTDSFSASDTDGTDDMTLFYITCPKKGRSKDDFDDNLTTDPHLRTWYEQQEDHHRRQQQQLGPINSYKNCVSSSDIVSAAESINYKAQTIDCDRIFFDEDEVDEVTIATFSVSRLSVIGNNTDKYKRMLNLPIAEAVPITESNVDNSLWDTKNKKILRIGSAASADSDQLLEILSLISNTSQRLTQTLMLILREEGFPLGLSKHLIETRDQFALRFWIIDNSGSMRTCDGRQFCHAVCEKKKGSIAIESNPIDLQTSKTCIATCSRWTEVQGTVIDHIGIAGLLRMPSMFRLLNGSIDCDGSQGEVSVSLPAGQLQHNQQLQHDDVNDAIRYIKRSTPKGGTPITLHLVEIRKQIERIQSTLLEQGRTAVVIVVTDGLPTDEDGNTTNISKHEFLDALRSFHDMPVWIVIRLCTDDTDVIKYYNAIDKEIETQLEVLDDFLGEAKEVYEYNPWLNYSLSLHRCREMGFHHRIVDVIDERPLDKHELHEFLQVVFGSERFTDSPNIHSNWKAYKAFLGTIVKSEGKHWCAITGKMQYWVDMKCLDCMYGFNYFGWVKGWNKVESKRDSKRKYLHFRFWRRRKENMKPSPPIDESVEVAQWKLLQRPSPTGRSSLQQQPVFLQSSLISYPINRDELALQATSHRNQSLTSSSSRPEHRKKADPPAIGRSKSAHELDYFDDSGSYPGSDDDFPADSESYIEETIADNDVYVECTRSLPNICNSASIRVHPSFAEASEYIEESIYEEETIYDEESVYDEETVEEVINAPSVFSI